MRALGDLAAQGVALYKGFSLVVAPGRQGAVLRNDFVVGA